VLFSYAIEQTSDVILSQPSLRASNTDTANAHSSRDQKEAGCKIKSFFQAKSEVLDVRQKQWNSSHYCVFFVLQPQLTIDYSGLSDDLHSHSSKRNFQT
jgi:hypothetical protein